MALHLEELAASWLRGNHGCVRCAHSGWYLQFFCNHSCRPVSRRGMRSASTLRRHVCILQAVTGWTTSSPRLSSSTSCCAPKDREIGSFNSSAFDVSSVSSRTFSSLATTTMQDTSHGIASKWLYYCLPWQRMTYQARSKQCTIGPATVLWDHAHYLLINLSEHFFDTTVGLRPNLARMCG